MIPKFIHLQSHFIHLYFLTEFEIIFYIFYVMPYEKTVFKRIVKDMVKDMVKDVKNLIDDDTFSIAIPTNSNCALYQTDLDDANAKLWNYCVIYLGTGSAILLAVFIHDVWKHLALHNGGTSAIRSSPKHNSKSNLVAFGSNPNFVELTNKKTDVQDASNCSAIEVATHADIPVPFYLYYWRSSGFVAEFIKTTEFIVLVAIFEYFFFISIVNKFKIANSHTLMCDGMREMQKTP